MRRPIVSVHTLAVLAVFGMAACSADAPGPADSDTGDTSTDTASDISIDVALDIADVGDDPEPDVVPDTDPDVVQDTEPDVEPDIGMDTEPDVIACTTLGCACLDDADCDSDYCLDDADGAGFCSEVCEDMCTEAGFTCVPLDDGDAVELSLCLPSDFHACEVCVEDADCGWDGATCLALDDGTNGCAPPCGEGGLCPTGTECVTDVGNINSYCAPIDGVCTGCIDSDADGYGIGPDCAGPDHDDSDPNSYSGAPEVGDGADNEGHGATDEGFDLMTDAANCGAERPDRLLSRLSSSLLRIPAMARRIPPASFCGASASRLAVRASSTLMDSRSA